MYELCSLTEMCSFATAVINDGCKWHACAHVRRASLRHCNSWVIVTNAGEKPHQCAVCGKRFTASSNLYYHRMTHSAEKPHKCAHCPKSFPTPGDLRNHEYVHSADWPFKCELCARGFSKLTNLRNHAYLHTGKHVLVYCLCLCSRPLLSPLPLAPQSSRPQPPNPSPDHSSPTPSVPVPFIHCLTTASPFVCAGQKPFRCDLCAKQFALLCNLKSHRKTHDALSAHAEPLLEPVAIVSTAGVGEMRSCSTPRMASDAHLTHSAAEQQPPSLPPHWFHSPFVAPLLAPTPSQPRQRVNFHSVEDLVRPSAALDTDLSALAPGILEHSTRLTAAEFVAAAALLVDPHMQFSRAPVIEALLSALRPRWPRLCNCPSRNPQRALSLE